MWRVEEGFSLVGGVLSECVRESVSEVGKNPTCSRERRAAIDSRSPRTERAWRAWTTDSLSLYNVRQRGGIIGQMSPPGIAGASFYKGGGGLGVKVRVRAIGKDKANRRECLG